MASDTMGEKVPDVNIMEPTPNLINSFIDLRIHENVDRSNWQVQVQLTSPTGLDSALNHNVRMR
jgi:hypothetical protein